MAEEEKGVHVGSGGFRVDRSRMLDRLAKFGYLHSHDVVIALVRVAVLGKATRLGIKGLSKRGLTLRPHDGLEIAFDGEPFDEATLRNPYDCLFSSGSQSPRGALLARALLTLSKARPSELTLTSGGMCVRFTAGVLAPGGEELKRVVGTGPTTLRVVWERYGSEIVHGLGALADERLRHSPLPVDFDNVWIGADSTGRHAFVHRPRAPGSELHAAFERDGIRGRVEMPARIAPEKGRVDLYWAGARIEHVAEADFLPLPVDGFVDHEGFRLDLSAVAVARDDSFKAAAAALRREAVALALRAAREQAAVMEEAAALLFSEECRATWTAVHEGRLTAEPEPAWWDWSGRARDTLEARRKVYRAAVRMRWLRYCARNPGTRSSSTAELENALRAAPLFLSTGREPLSLAKLRATQERLGAVPASRRLGGEPGLWLSSSRDAALLPEDLALKRV